jgi:hypothetical protein
MNMTTEELRTWSNVFTKQDRSLEKKSEQKASYDVPPAATN